MAMALAAVTVVAATRMGRRSAAAVSLGAVAVGGVVCAAAWPALAVTLAVVLVVTGLALRAPAAAFVVALGLAGAEGLLKARLSIEHVPSAVEGGALVLDLVLAVAAVALLVRDRGRSLRAVVRGGGRAELIAWGLLGAWLVLSVVQLPLYGGLVDAAQGFRLTQAYVPLVLAGIALFPAVGDEERCTRWLLWVFGIVAAYAAFRAAVAPPAWFKEYASDRTGHTTLEGVLRDVGSFTSVVTLASFLVPVAVFSSTVGFLRRRLRVLAWGVAALAVVAVLASYVRIGIVAIGVGVLLLALIAVLAEGVPRRTRIAAIVGAVTIAGGVYGGALLAGGETSKTQTRAEGLSQPLSDQSIKDRRRLWQQSLRTIGRHPQGTGLGTVGHATAQGRRDKHTDNTYLKILQEQGILGGGLFILGLLGTAVLLARRVTRTGPLERPLAAAGVCAFTAFLVLCALGEYIETTGKIVAWTLLGIALWYGYGVNDDRSGTDAPRSDGLRP